MLKRLVGLEAEFILLDKEGNVRLIPGGWPQDTFPLLGEIRGEPGKDWAETVGNFQKELYRVRAMVDSWQCQMVFQAATKIDLKTYRKALKSMNPKEKETEVSQVKNIHGIDIADFSDQIIKNGKIQGAVISSGLHIHFSSEVSDKLTVYTPHYEKLQIPIQLGAVADSSTYLRLYQKISEKEEKTLKVQVSQITKPVINHIVRKMDDVLFEKMTPKEGRTKYRQPGFYELKPYGFEYRSLPSSDQTMANLEWITKVAFEALSEL